MNILNFLGKKVRFIGNTYDPNDPVLQELKSRLNPFIFVLDHQSIETNEVDNFVYVESIEDSEYKKIISFFLERELRIDSDILNSYIKFEGVDDENRT